MSLTLDKLRALRRQAGASDAATVAAPAAPPLPGNTPATPVSGPGSEPASASASGAAMLPAAATPCRKATPAQMPAHTLAAPLPAGQRIMLAAATNAPRSTQAAPALATALPASPPGSAMDWITHSIRHANPAALAARAHGRPTARRPSPHNSPARTQAPSDAQAMAAVVATGVTPIPATTPPPNKPAGSTSALDWINTSIHHADPAALAARAHGKPSALRPLQRNRHGRIQAPPDAQATVAATAPSFTGSTSALDWINTAIRHADPAALAWNSQAPLQQVSNPGTTPASANTASSAPAPSTTTVITPRNVGDLQRLLATRQRVQATVPAIAHSGPLRRDLPGEEIAPGLWLQQAHVPMPVPDGPLPLDFARRPEHRVDPHQLLFFDTETTGLAGGSGTRAFMIGAADWHHDPMAGPGLRVRQLLMATLGAESAMLQTFASWLAADTVLSSFNGRSYDAPLLKTRYRLARLPEPLSAHDHIDLLHPARRRWKGQWENCRLGTIERNVLGIAREDDLPGSQAPGAWLDYLRGGSSDLLHRVAAHNHQDVVTLALLLQQLAQPAFALPATPHD